MYVHAEHIMFMYMHIKYMITKEGGGHSFKCLCIHLFKCLYSHTLTHPPTHTLRTHPPTHTLTHTRSHTHPPYTHPHTHPYTYPHRWQECFVIYTSYNRVVVTMSTRNLLLPFTKESISISDTEDCPTDVEGMCTIHDDVAMMSLETMLC